MLNMHKEIDFLSKCEIPTSAFDITFARNNNEWLEIKNLYDNFSFSLVDNPIPKILHFIWLGSELPNHYRLILDGWKNNNPSFDLIVWDDKSSKDFIKDKQSNDLFLRSESFGLKSDVLRYEILKYYGGIYVDTDFLCYSNEFDKLNSSCSFYAGICQERVVQINNGIMASAPNHPILNYCIHNISDKTFLNIECKITRVLYQTGPWLLTWAIQHHIKHGNKDIIIFPSETFHPFPSLYRNDDPSLEFINSFIKPWTMACHLWHCSWQPNSKFFAGMKNEF